MWLNIWNVVLYTFFIYGVVCFVVQFFNNQKPMYINKDIEVVSIAFVKNQQDTIEATVKGILISITGKLIVVDLGSNDDTWNILEKLKLNNNRIQILKKHNAV